MTLIATAISRYGIVQAADPSLTSYPGQVASTPRIFRLGFLNAALSITGGYVISGAPLDRWMEAVIDDYERTAESPTLIGFAEHVRNRLTPQPDPLHRRTVHIAGYVGSGSRSHPEVYYIRNIRGKAADGSYGKPGRNFMVSEVFWSLDYSRDETKDTLRSGGARIYLDGFPENRVAYMLLHHRLHDFYNQAWGSSNRFRRPRSLRDITSLIELDMAVNAAFMRPAKHQSRRLGDRLEIEVIAAPSNAITL
jgi:hypothetical protein